MSIKHQFMHFKWFKGEIPATFITCFPRNTTLSNNMHSLSLRLTELWSDFLYISRRLIIKLIRRKSPFLWYSFNFTVVISHLTITFHAICMDKILKDFTSLKDTYYAALTEIDNIYIGKRNADFVWQSIPIHILPKSISKWLWWKENIICWYKINLCCLLYYRIF